MDNNFDKAVGYLQSRTAYDEIVIGCFLNNYGNHRQCGACQSSGCKDAAKCKRLNRVLTERGLSNGT